MKYFQGYFQKIKNFSLVSSTVVTTDGQRKEPKELYLKSSAMSQIITIISIYKGVLHVETKTWLIGFVLNSFLFEILSKSIH